MSKLKRFNKTNKKNIMPLVALCVIVAVVSAAISYAVYQKEDEILFINAKVGHFETSSSDIELAMTLDGNDIDTPPSKGYYNVVVECDHADGRWDEEEWAAVIGNITSNRVKCNVNFETLETLASIVEIGDYISMTPTSTSYTISTSLTGYSSNQTINPSELNLWRVIRKNEDGTVDVVSEYVSSTSVYFKGLTGFLNYIGALNTIAAQYTDGVHVQSTRHMGYSDQTEYFSSYATSATTASLQNDFDKGSYKIDSDLVMNALGTTKAKKIDGSDSSYSITSRWTNSSSTEVVGFLVRCAPDGSIYRYTYGTTQDGVGQGFPMYEYKVKDGSLRQRGEMGWPVRPILTFKSNIEILSGDGKSVASAYQLK